MKLFSIAASEIPVFLGLCRGIKWAPTFLLGILVQPCDKTLSLLIVLWCFHLYWESILHFVDTSFVQPWLAVCPCSSKHTSSKWPTLFEHLKYGRLVPPCLLQRLPLPELSGDTSTLLWITASRDVLFDGMEGLIHGLLFGPHLSWEQLNVKPKSASAHL